MRSAAPRAGAAARAAAAGCTVGVSWNNYQEERWAKWDEPAIKAAVEAGGGKYISNDAKSSAETQASNVENLISQGAKVLIILAQDGTAIKPSVATRRRSGIPVIAYDRLIEDPGALYITFDNVEVGRMQARGDLRGQCRRATTSSSRATRPTPTPTSCAAAMTRSSATPSTSGDIKIVGETYTDNWDPSKAQTEMEQFLTANNNKVDAVLSENDGMAGGVVAALDGPGPRRQGAGVRPGRRPGRPQPRRARHPDGRRLEGRPRSSARPPARPPSQLCNDTDVDARSRARRRSRRRVATTLSSILLKPQPITKDNLNVVLDAGWITKDDALPGRDRRFGRRPAADRR